MNTTHPVQKTVTEVEGSLRDSGLRGDGRTRRCSNGVVTPRWRMVFSLAPGRAAASRACCSLRARQ